jgi:colicin import membrane protein
VAQAAHDQLLPQPPGGLLPGAILALLAHAAMLAALTLAVQWRTSAPEAVTAELWSAVPQVAAPPAPPPAPEPAPAPPPPAPAPAPPPPKRAEAEPDAQIAIEQAKKAKAERERQERLREEREQAQRDKAERERALKAKAEKEREQREAEAKQREQQQREAAQRGKEREKAEERRLTELRQKQLERMMGQVGGSSSTSGGTAAVSSGPSASYAGRLIAAIKPNVVFTETISGNPAAEVEVRAGPSGSILSRRLVRSSGNKDWDEAVLRAIDRTGTLPRDVDGRVPAVILMAFRPNELN